MTRRIHLQLAAIVSDDGTRCAAEWPHRDGGYGHCTAFDRPLVMDLGHGAYDRCPTCIAAEQAAASVPSCEGDAKAATLALRNVRALATRLRRTDPENAAHSAWRGSAPAIVSCSTSSMRMKYCASA